MNVNTSDSNTILRYKPLMHALQQAVTMSHNALCTKRLQLPVTRTFSFQFQLMFLIIGIDLENAPWKDQDDADDDDDDELKTNITHTTHTGLWRLFLLEL